MNTLSKVSILMFCMLTNTIDCSTSAKPQKRSCHTVKVLMLGIVTALAGNELCKSASGLDIYTNVKNLAIDTARDGINFAYDAASVGLNSTYATSTDLILPHVSAACDLINAFLNSITPAIPTFASFEEEFKTIKQLINNGNFIAAAEIMANTFVAPEDHDAFIPLFASELQARISTTIPSGGLLETWEDYNLDYLQCPFPGKLTEDADDNYWRRKANLFKGFSDAT